MSASAAARLIDAQLDGPVLTVDATVSRPLFGVTELWTYHELLYFLTVRDLKVRYKQTALGVIWIVMQPLLFTLVFTIFLGHVARVDSGGIPYPVFAYAALLPWSFFSSAVANGAGSLVGSAHLITKVYFPRLVIPTAAVAARLVDVAISLALLGVMMVWYRIAPTRNLFMIPPLLAVTGLLALALGTWLSAVNVRYRDVGVMVPVMLQVWMFVSPVVYSSRSVPAKWHALYILNPLVGLIENFRTAVFGGAFDWPAFTVSVVCAVALLLEAARMFRATERGFADVI
ncbi:MAG: type transporter [Gemmatimonadetes bacterium]|nr:type transporter [Gemmatimonadota bacterium]